LVKHFAFYPGLQVSDVALPVWDAIKFRLKRTCDEIADMSDAKPVERRNFLKSAAGIGAAALSSAPAILAQRGSNDRIGVASIGVGTRGHFLLDWVQEAPNTEIRVICDLYDGNIQRAQKQAFNKKAVVIKEWEKAIASPDVDVVLIATPDFWHAPMAIRAAELKKHIYVEKGLCRTLDEAKAIRKAVRDNGVTLQLGHHQNSEAAFVKARDIFRSGKLGKVALVACMRKILVILNARRRDEIAASAATV